MSVIIRERERERDRDFDERSSYRVTSPRDRDQGRTTTVKRYVIPAEEDRRDTRRTIVYESDRDRGYDREPDRRESRGFDETRIIRRERTPEPEPEPERRVERDIRIERIEREREPERRFDREYRFDREIDRLAPRREPYELERYSRSTEYFPRPDPPQPIIIRQEPQQIIIQEAPRAPIVVPAPQPPVVEERETDFQVIQRSEVADNRSVVSRRTDKTDKPKKDRDDDYYYERRVREVSRGDRDDDFYEEKFKRREVSPGDSVSQVGRRHRRDKDYSSDDSMVYVRRETREKHVGRDRSSSGSPDHRRHLAEGVVAGIGAAELLRHHRKREGEEVSGSGGRIARDLGAAGLGAVAAEGISRAKSAHRERSRHRRRRSSSGSDTSRSRDRGRERRHRKKSKERSRSRSRVKQLAGLGLGAAAVGAAVAYANRKNKQNQANDRRSRSRTRRHSAGPEVGKDDARNPQHQTRKVAQAGLAGAAIAGLVERARSKSRGGRDRSRSKSRIRQGLPIAAAGLGSAAIAKLYENNQAKKEEKEARRTARADRAERKLSRSRSRSRSVHYEGSRDQPNDPGLIEYGDQPVYSAGGAPGYGYRPENQQYSDALVPGAAAAGAYEATRDRSRDRRDYSNSSGSDSGDRRRRRNRRKKDDSRSRSRTRELATAGLAAGAGAYAASEHEKRKARRKEERRARRRKSTRNCGRWSQDRQSNYTQVKKLSVNKQRTMLLTLLRGKAHTLLEQPHPKATLPKAIILPPTAFPHRLVLVSNHIHPSRTPKVSTRLHQVQASNPIRTHINRRRTPHHQELRRLTAKNLIPLLLVVAAPRGGLMRM